MLNVSYWLYLIVLIFAPLAFGTVELWSLVTVEVLTVGAAVLLFFSGWFYKKKLYRIPGLLPLLLLLGLMAVQLIPLPAAAVKILSPGTYAAYSPILAHADSGGWIPLSINQKATLQEFLRIGCYALVYILTIQLLSLHSRLKRTVHTVILLAGGIAFLAIVQGVSSPDQIYWFRNVPANASPFGPWINPNQFSGFMEMLAPLALGLFLFYKPRVHPDENRREKFVNFFTMPGSNLHLFLGFATVLMVLSVFVSLCRGGILTITLSALVFILLYNFKKPQHGRAAVMVVIGSAVLAVSWFGWDTIISEFNRGFDASGNISDARFTLWSDSLQMIRDYPLFGGGFGTFIHAYPYYQTIESSLIFDHAHNDYIELLTDGGIVGFVLAGWFVLAVLRHGWNMIRARRDQYAILLGIGAVTGIVAMLMHSVTDFNMHNGAVGLYFFVLCGLLVSSVNSRFNYYDSGTLLGSMPRSCNTGFLLAAAMLLGTTLLVQYGVFRARVEFNGVKNIYISRQLSPERLQLVAAAITRAEKHDPLESLYSYRLGAIEWFLKDRQKTLNHFLRAARKDPMEGATLQRIGLLVTDEVSSKALMEEGYSRALNKDELAANLAEYLLWTGHREDAKQVLAARLQSSPRLIRAWSPLLDNYDFSREEITDIMPPSPDAWINYGAFQEQLGALEDAEYFRSTALTQIEQGGKIKPQWFSQLMQFHTRQKQPEKALQVLRQAVDTVPDYAYFHILLGDYFRKEGITYRARQEYEQVLILEPGNDIARKRLRQMGLKDAY